MRPRRRRNPVSICRLYPGAERRNWISRWSNSRTTGIECASAAGMAALAGLEKLRFFMAVVKAKVSMLEPFSGEQCQPYGPGLQYLTPGLDRCLRIFGISRPSGRQTLPAIPEFFLQLS